MRIGNFALWQKNAHYHSDEYDKYIDASKTTSGKERMDNLFNAEKTLLEDGALVPLLLR